MKYAVIGSVTFDGKPTPIPKYDNSTSLSEHEEKLVNANVKYNITDHAQRRSNSAIVLSCTLR